MLHPDRSSALARVLRLAALGVVAILLAGACGRAIPTSPPIASRDAGAGTSRRFDSQVDSAVVVTLAPGIAAQAVADDHAITVVDAEPDEHCAAFLPRTGQTPAELATELATDPRVVTSETDGWFESAESRQQSFSFDDGFGSPSTYREQASSDAIGLRAAHRRSLGSGVRVAILDTGSDPTHPALVGHVAGGWDFVDKDATPWDATNGIDDDGDGHVDEAFGHGTHVAGITALVAPDAELLIVRVLDADGRGDVLDVAAGIRWAVTHGARVINLSLGSLQSSNAIQNAMEEAEQNGILCVASAGNWGAEQPEEFPARSSHAHAIAATDVAAHPAAFTSFADYVVLSAPGVGVRSAFPGGGYRLWNGTSMSVPFVSGAAALLWSVHPGWSIGQVLGRLGSTSTPIANAAPSQLDRLGQGMLNIGAALAVEPIVAGGSPEAPAELPTPRRR